MSSASLARAIKLAGKLESKVKQTQNSKRGHHNIVGCALVRFVCFTNALTTSKKKTEYEINGNGKLCSSFKNNNDQWGTNQ